ncbi:SAVMC3_10250 family protein [Streptomyces sp. NPDC090022]|uniref:SAVMC3_10250 family protein n=1 Tax=Streptomyces sp. NPDC090022 TaxID=3365920 RepID=UPI0038016A5D
MREFIYVSDAKLSQFVPQGARAPRARALRLTTPVGGVDLDAPAPDGEQSRLRQLDRVDKHLEKSARWFEEPGLRAGQWVQFEVLLRCVALNGPYRHMVLFADPAPGEEPDHAGDCRLLMHGSAHHLLGRLPVPIDGPLLEDIEGGASLGTTFVTRAGEAVHALALQPGARADETDPAAPSPAHGHAGPALPGAGVRALLNALDAAPELVGTASWMRGYARVTRSFGPEATGTRCLVATPLTVEFVHEAP